MTGKASGGWYGELPPPVLAAAIIRAVFLAILPFAAWMFARRGKDTRTRAQRIPTRTIVLVLIASGAMNILRQPRWAKGKQPVDLDEESVPAGAGS